MDLMHSLEQCPIIAILRGIRPHEVEAVCSTLEQEGITIIEIPLNSPNALESISILARLFGTRMLVGAGTLSTSKQVAEVAAVGGRLIVTPHADLSIVRAAKADGLVTIPGFFTPTEAFSLLQAGADAIKLFPSDVLGISMLKAMQAVLPKNTIVIPVGGVDVERIGPWMDAGARGIGVGSSIYKPGDDVNVVKAKAQALIGAARIARR